MTRDRPVHGVTRARPVRIVPEAERRARLAVRRGLGPGCAHPDIVAATRAMTAWHATELPSVHLAIRARTRGVTVADVDAELDERRTLVKQLGMRRTLFAVDRELLPAVIGGPGLRVAGPERRRLVKERAQAGDIDDVESWLATAERARRTRRAVPRATNCPDRQAEVPANAALRPQLIGATAGLVGGGGRGLSSQRRWPVGPRRPTTGPRHR